MIHGTITISNKPRKETEKGTLAIKIQEDLLKAGFDFVEAIPKPYLTIECVALRTKVDVNKIREIEDYIREIDCKYEIQFNEYQEIDEMFYYGSNVQ